MRVLLATTSEHKRDEIAALLADVSNLRLLTLRDVPVEMPEETGATMRANARLKADAGARASGLMCLADDSGLEVDALNGEPGVRSARWHDGTDADRMFALLERLRDTDDAKRAARYRCALCLSWPLGELLTYDGELSREEFEGTVEGRIAREPRGVNGFGYDPIFELTRGSGDCAHIGQTMAQVEPMVKAAISHRSRAVSRLLPVLRGFAGG